jgi:AraC-like DNA-binding protein
LDGGIAAWHPHKQATGMLLSHRETTVADLDAQIDTHALVHTRYRVLVVGRRNVVTDDALLAPAFPRTGHVTRPIVGVLLGGRARIRAFGREAWLTPGDVTVIEAKGAVSMRQESDAGFLSVAIEWDVGSLSSAAPGGFTRLRLGAHATRALGAAASSLAALGLSSRDGASIGATVLGILRAAGVPFEPASACDLVEDVPTPSNELTHALDRALSHLEAAPGWVDIEEALHLSSRHVSRVVATHAARYGMAAAGWRALRSRRQLLMGATLMTAPGARVERVARAVGYGSARAFSRAAMSAGLMHPSRIAEAVRLLA